VAQAPLLLDHPRPFSVMNESLHPGRFLIIGIHGKHLDSKMLSFLSEVQPNGICLFSRNIESISQLKQLTSDISEALANPPFFAIDHEGGRVDRLRRIVEPSPAASSIKTKESAATFGRAVGNLLASFGISLNFAPVVDINLTDSISNGLATRCFSSRLEEVVELAGEFLNSMEAAGVAGCVKHFPGLGRSVTDSHDSLPIVSESKETLLAEDLAAFTPFINRDITAIMTGHATYPSLVERNESGRTLPASICRQLVSGTLREQMGHSGIVVTDDLEMGALKEFGSISEIVLASLCAGNDQALVCNDPENVRQALDGVNSWLSSAEPSDVAQGKNRIDRWRTKIEAQNFEGKFEMVAIEESLKGLKPRE